MFSNRSSFLYANLLRVDQLFPAQGLQDTGNGFIWSDEELSESFPALAQMPLGAAKLNHGFNTLGMT